MITQNTARLIYNAHAEIDRSNGLIVELKKSIEKEHKERLEKQDQDPFKKQLEFRGPYCDMGIPTDFSSSSKRILEVDPKLSLKVIESHIKNKKKELKKLMELARIELKSTSNN